ncbi:hypothetical protein [Rosistilla ulvae]|uniref:hypothetical protein n=1 Tax=Rosistilla ulvae TaxID=1930277 RepID=UPI0011A9E522|nr:hypothetical protein [Rosistilla ulvae]
MTPHRSERAVSSSDSEASKKARKFPETRRKDTGEPAPVGLILQLAAFAGKRISIKREILVAVRHPER